MPRKPWTDEQKRQALDLAAVHGTNEAGRRTGIPAGTIASWRNRNGDATLQSELVRASVQAKQQKWAERRLDLIHEMGRVAAKALAVADEKLDSGTPGPAKDAVTTMAILVDKAQLLSGEVTTRNEYRDARAALLDEARSHVRSLRSVA